VLTNTLNDRLSQLISIHITTATIFIGDREFTCDFAMASRERSPASRILPQDEIDTARRPTGELRA
jgi:hypothetical protein